MESVLINGVAVVAWVVALPLRATAWIIVSIRARLYDPEKVVCPACCYRGDSGTNNKTCTIKFVRTSTQEKGAIEHTCLRCSANFYSKIFLEADKWLPQLTTSKIEKAAKETTL